MWIIRFQKLNPRDYNSISRILKKAGFSPRRISPIVFAKALILHKIQKKSWRVLSQYFGVSHVALFKLFQEISPQKELYDKIFHTFSSSKSIVYIGDIKVFTQDDLDNSEHFSLLTKTELASILEV
jgi:hypothetical protein